MAKRTRAFYVGAFVLFGVSIAIVTLVWLGIYDWFAEKNTYVTYFDVSVQGLNVDSDVKFRGVSVGKVAKIQVAPDNYLIEVTMHLDPEFAIGDSMRTKLGLTGITGLRYIEMDYVGQERRDLHPEYSFTPPHPVIHSQPGGFEMIEQALNEIYDKLVAVDTEGISFRLNRFLDTSTETMEATSQFMARAETAFISADSIITSPVFTDWLVNLDNTIGHLDNIIADISSLEIQRQNTKIDSIITNLQEGSVHFYSILEELDSQVEGIALDQRTDTLATNMDALMESSQHFIQRSQYASLQTLNNLNTTIYELNSAIDQLNALIISMESYPSNILYSAPPPRER